MEDIILCMGRYRVEAGPDYKEPREFDPGYIMATQLYTESFPSGTSLSSYRDRAIRPGRERDGGFVIPGILGFQQDRAWFLYLGHDPDTALYQARLALNFSQEYRIPRTAYFNDKTGKIELPNERSLRYGGLKILWQRGPDEFTARIIPPQ